MRWLSEFMMGLSRYRNSPSCFWDREIRRRRDRIVLQRHKAGCSDVIAKPLLLRALNRQRSAAGAGTTAVSDCKEIGINTVVEFIDRRPIGLVRAENAALLVKVQRLEDKKKQVTQQLEERNSCFSEYKRETNSKFLRLVKERHTCNLQVTDVQKSNGHLEAEIALLREQKVEANTQAENAALLIKVQRLKDRNKLVTQQLKERNSCFREYKRKTSLKFLRLVKDRDTCNLQLADVQKSNAEMQAEIVVLQVQEAYANMEAEKRALEVDLLKDRIRLITDQRNKIDSIFDIYREETCSKIRDLLQLVKMRNANVNVQVEIVSLLIQVENSMHFLDRNRAPSKEEIEIECKQLEM